MSARKLLHTGRNPTADLIVTRTWNDQMQLLLIRRSAQANTEAGKLALPGGFVEGTTAADNSWQKGDESYLLAAVRELNEETGLDLSSLDENAFRLIGIFDAPFRDPRNTTDAWTESHVFHYHLHNDTDHHVTGGDDAEDAAWFSINEILALGKKSFAFDHFEILDDHGFLQNSTSQ